MSCWRRCPTPSLSTAPRRPDPRPVDRTVSDAALGAVDRLDEIPGIGPNVAQVILAEIGLDMSRFPTAAHLVSWAKLCPRTIQSVLRKSPSSASFVANPRMQLTTVAAMIAMPPAMYRPDCLRGCGSLATNVGVRPFRAVWGCLLDPLTVH